MGEQYENVSLYAEHFEDPGPPSDHLRPESVERSAGELEVGALINGARFPFYRGPAGRFLKDLRLAEEASKADADAKASESQQDGSQQSQQDYQQPPSY